MNNQQKPGEYDAVLGGHSPSPEFAVVLGGIQGVIFRYSSPNPQVRIAALAQALNYSQAGLDILIQALNDQSPQVQNAAYSLLQSRTEPKVKQALSIFEDGSLKSAIGMDYQNLRDLLLHKRWRDADDETRRLMLAVAKREKEGWLNHESIDNFPCEDLGMIDQLWVKYSHGRFGFSVQKRIYQSIYQSLGGKKQWDYDIWRAFGEKIGWRKGGSWLYYIDIIFDLTAVEGHLPVYECWFGEKELVWGVNFFSHVGTCQL